MLCVLSGLLGALAIVSVCSHGRPAGAALSLTAHTSLIAARTFADSRQPCSELLPARPGKHFFRRIMRPRTVKLVAPSLTTLVADTGVDCLAVLPPPDRAIVAGTLPLLI
ncbi:MAG: hypothetical protein ACM3VW_01375 [Bacteroidota bacterium]